MEKGGKFGIGAGDAPCAINIKRFGEARGGHAFGICGPAPAELIERDRGSLRIAGLAVWKMAQEQSFVTRALPDQIEPLAFRKLAAAFVALPHQFELVRIEQNEPIGVWFAMPGFPARDFKHRFLDNRQWVAATWLKKDWVKMDRPFCRIGEPLEERYIALLALAFATDEQPGTKLAFSPYYASARWSHPILGTAP